MKVRSILSTLALTGVLVTNASAGEPSVPAPGDRASFPYGEAMPSPEVIPGAATPEGGSIEGHVASIEHDAGRLVLDTQEGLLAVRTSPEQLAGIEVGDFVTVSFVTDEQN
jgi:hypothetical protein